LNTASQSTPSSVNDSLLHVRAVQAVNLGAGQIYLISIKDKDGNAFGGSKTYKQTVPPNAPVKQYWSLTAYDRELHLWGTWCIQCITEMPTVQKLYDHYRNDPQVKFLIISRMDSPSSVRSYAHRNRLDLPFYVTHDDDIPQSMHLNQFPSTFLYAKDGTLVSKHIGAADWSDRLSSHSSINSSSNKHITGRQLFLPPTCPAITPPTRLVA